MSARILVVDDVPANVRMLTAQLSAAYYQVDTATSGAACIEALRPGAVLPDVILLDVMMPDMDGFETCRHLKADPATWHIPVLMVTALGQPEDRVRGLDAGADDFLTKPIDFDTLIARVRGLVRLKRGADEWRLRMGAVEEFGLALRPQATLTDRSALVIDDWEPWSRAAEDALGRDGVHTRAATGAASAFAVLDGVRPDLIVLSLSLADEDALQLLSRLQVDPRCSGTPVLVVAETRDRLLTALDMGASDWLSRPVDPNELRARARNQVRRKQYQDQLRAELSGALRLALVDPLTGLHNRRSLMRHLQTLVGSPTEVAVLMIDVDHFKSINDRWGHAAGDRALGQVAATLGRHVRASDMVARYGGEEFVVVMAGATLADAAEAAERLRRAVEQLTFSPARGPQPDVGRADDPPAGLTVSVGVAALNERCFTPEQLLEAADLAQYEAKRGGRNRIARTA